MNVRTTCTSRRTGVLSRVRVGFGCERWFHALSFAVCLIAGYGAAATEVSSFQAGDGGWHLGTLAIGNIDADPQAEIVVPYRDSSGSWFLDAFKSDGTRLSGFPYAANSDELNVSPTLFDLDNDGRAEIIFTRGNRVIALRGDATPFWDTAVTRSNYLPTGGYMTVTNGFYWSAGGSFIGNLPSSAVFSSQVSSPMVADINGDGTREVVTAWKIDPDSTSSAQDFNPFINDIWGSGEWGTVGETWSGGVLFLDAANGMKKHIYHLHQLVESGLALGQADSDNALEVYVLNDSDSVVCFDKTLPHGFYGNGTLHKQFGKNQRLMSGSYQQGVDVFTADIDGDGLDEVLVPTPHRNPLWQPSETILDDDGAILWRKWNQSVTYTLNQWQNNACMIPINPDRDNRVDVLSFTQSFEIAFRSWNGIELADRPGWPKNFYPYLPTPPVVGDVDGDGHEEIVIGTYDPGQSPSNGALYIFALDGSLKSSIAVAGGLKHVPSIADVDNNGSLEVIYRSLTGRIFIHSFGGTTTCPVSWATHRGSAQRDGNLGADLYPVGTPVIIARTGGVSSASFTWRNSAVGEPLRWRIHRAQAADSPFHHIITVPGAARSYSDVQLNSGTQYLYEVEAVYPWGTVRSAPFSILTSLNRNLVRNGGFEENDNCHWDKWFTGELHWNQMTAESLAFQGNRSMAIRLTNNASSGSISQFGQYGTPDAYLPVTPDKLYSFGGFFKSSGFSAPSQHWLEWSSTKTGEDTNARPARTYPDYFTPLFVVGTNVTEWTYANRTFLMPAGFPNVGLIHRYTTTVPATGKMNLDNVFFRQLPDPTATNWSTLIPFGATWRFWTETPPLDWFATDFNSQSWQLGIAKMGAGSGPANIITALPVNRPGYYFRRTFIASALPIEELLLSATCTDGGTNSLAIYLNGSPIVTTGVGAVTGQGNQVKYYDLTPFSHLLKYGTNTIAIYMPNVWEPSWDDVAFDVSLKAIYGIVPVPVTLAAPSPSPLLSIIPLHITAPAQSLWRLESTDSLSPPSWQVFEQFIGIGSPILLYDIGQNGRLLPSQTSKRFYRLRPE